MTATGLELHEAPDFAEPLVAWRVWRVVATKDGYRLGSVVKTALWAPGEPFSAECLREPTLAALFRRKPKAHAAPDDECECGIYAGRLSGIREYMAPTATEAVAHVVGEVMLWGTVIECERGFRASHAYPRRLYVPVGGVAASGHRFRSLAAALEVYGIPVEALDSPASEATRRLEQMLR
ncbi:MAG TPA: hypothetical protein VFI04_03515 [Gaiellaceae bacterium]|jgi:hypothetical protein|nr:hypothetical protein [Gaiellaceae bacterium]